MPKKTINAGRMAFKAAMRNRRQEGETFAQTLEKRRDKQRRKIDFGDVVLLFHALSEKSQQEVIPIFWALLKQKELKKRS